MLTGTGSWDYDRDRVVLDVTVSGRFAGSYRCVRTGSSATIERQRVAPPPRRAYGM